MEKDDIQQEPSLRDTLESAVDSVAKIETAPEAPKVEAEPEVKRPNRPSTWKKDYWEHWDTLDPKLAEYINQREGEYAKGVSTYKAEAEQARELREAILPFEPDLQKANLHPATWIRSLGTAHKILVYGSPQEKLQMFTKMANEYGVPVQALLDQNVAQQFLQAPQAPDVQTLVQQQFQAYESQKEVERFMAEAETKYPHFEQVKETMIGLLQSGLVKDLEGAYAKAVRMDESVWEAEQARKLAESEAEQKRIQAAAVEKARSKVIRSSSPMTGAANNGAKDRRAMLEEAFDQYGSQV